MKYNTIKISYIFFIAIALVSACKTKKNIGKKLPEETIKLGELNKNNKIIFDGIKTLEGNYNYLACKGECEYNDGKNAINFDVQLEMEKGNFIFLRATYLLGIEVAKIYITPTQIQIINHWEKTNTLAKYSYLKKFSSTNLQFQNIENLILGNALFKQEEGITQIDSNATQYVLKTIVENAMQQCYYGKNKIAKLETNELEEIVNNKKLEVKYLQYIANGTDFYPSDLAINISAEKNLGCSLKLFNFAFTKKKDPVIRVPSNYKIITY